MGIRDQDSGPSFSWASSLDALRKQVGWLRLQLGRISITKQLSVGVLVLVSLAGTIGALSVARTVDIGRAFDDFASANAQLVDLSNDLSRNVSQSLILGQRIAFDDTDEMLQVLVEELEKLGIEFEASVAELRTLAQSSFVDDRLREAVTDHRILMRAIDAAIQSRREALFMDEQIASSLKTLKSEFAQFRGAAEAESAPHRAIVSAFGDQLEADADIARSDIIDVTRFHYPYFQAIERVQRAAADLSEAALVYVLEEYETPLPAHRSEVDRTREALQEALNRLDTVAGTAPASVPASGDVSALTSSLETILGLIEGPEGVIALQDKRLAALSRAHERGAEFIRRGAQIRESLSGLLAEANGIAAAARTKADAAINSTLSNTLFILSLSLVVAAMVVWHANRRIADPVSDISRAMRSIVRGDQSVEMPAPTGTRELRELAAAARAFRRLSRRSNELARLKSLRSDIYAQLSEAKTLEDFADTLLRFMGGELKGRHAKLFLKCGGELKCFGEFGRSESLLTGNVRNFTGENARPPGDPDEPLVYTSLELSEPETQGATALIQFTAGGETVGLLDICFHRQVNGRGRRFMMEIANTVAVAFDRLCRELTAQALSEELTDAKETAEAANQAKSDFLAFVSHEIRTPLNGVLGMARLMLAGELSNVQRNYARTIADSGEALLSILNDVLDIAKIEAGKLRTEEAAFCLDDLLASVSALWQSRARAKGVDFDLHVEDRVPRLLKGDPNRLRQILFNLVSNALKFTDEGSVRIGVTMAEESAAARPDGRVQIRFAVTDTGAGISDEDQQHLFEKFTQAENTSPRRHGGTGLGLAICKQLAELLGGEIGVESVLGEGSTFWFTVAVRVDEERARAMEAGATTEPAAGGSSAEADAISILVAEDHPVNQQIVLAMLSGLGHRVRVVNNGAEAVEAVTGEEFDIVLMDVQMPVMDGPTATKRIRQMQGAVSAIPVIALTANAMVGDREKYLDCGMTDYVTKPIDPPLLYAAIERCLRRPAIPSAMAPAKEQGPREAANANGEEALEELLRSLNNTN